MKLRAHHRSCLLAARTPRAWVVWPVVVVVVDVQTKPFGLISVRLGGVGYALSPDSCYLFAYSTVQYPISGGGDEPDRHRTGYLFISDSFVR